MRPKRSERPWPGSRSRSSTREACFSIVAGSPRIGILAIQGGFEAHATALRKLGCDVTEVRRPAELESLDGLVIPGGESTTIEKGLEAYGLAGPVKEFARSRRPLLGTCAGLILLDRHH